MLMLNFSTEITANANIMHRWLITIVIFRLRLTQHHSTVIWM